jgi:hypothetical protein
MPLINIDRPLLWTALFHAAIGVFCLALLLRPAVPILGVHPALKPMKFGFSIAVFLGSMAVILPMLPVNSGVRSIASIVLCATMALEMGPIAGQAATGTTSHFNVTTPRTGGLWLTMVLAIVVATLTMLALAVSATVSSLNFANGKALPSLLAHAIRLGLWSFMLAAISGFAMGSRGKHTVGGSDGGVGMMLTNWSRNRGDLRVSHFFALHALQVLPALALVILQIPVNNTMQQGLFWLPTLVWFGLTLRTLQLALSGRPWP